MPRAHIGSKIRQRRKALGRTQAALAGEVGISASYLNLIEANKRQIGGHLLQKVAKALDIDLDSLDGAAEKRLAEHLREIASEPLLRDLEIDHSSVFDVIGRHPKWARALVTIHRALQDQTELAAALIRPAQSRPLFERRRSPHAYQCDGDSFRRRDSGKRRRSGDAAAPAFRSDHR